MADYGSKREIYGLGDVGYDLLYSHLHDNGTPLLSGIVQHVLRLL